MFDFFAGVPDRGVDDCVAGVDVPDSVDLPTVAVVASCVGDAERRIGGSNCRLDVSDKLRSATVLEGSSGLPSMMRRTSAGRVVDAERNSRMLETVWIGLMLSLMAVEIMLAGWYAGGAWVCLLLPSQMLTLMAMLSADSSLFEV